MELKKETDQFLEMFLWFVEFHLQHFDVPRSASAYLLIGWVAKLGGIEWTHETNGTAFDGSRKLVLKVLAHILFGTPIASSSQRQNIGEFDGGRDGRWSDTDIAVVLDVAALKLSHHDIPRSDELLTYDCLELHYEIEWNGCVSEREVHAICSATSNGGVGTVLGVFGGVPISRIQESRMGLTHSVLGLNGLVTRLPHFFLVQRAGSRDFTVPIVSFGCQTVAFLCREIPFNAMHVRQNFRLFSFA